MFSTNQNKAGQKKLIRNRNFSYAAITQHFQIN